MTERSKAKRKSTIRLRKLLRAFARENGHIRRAFFPAEKRKRFDLFFTETMNHYMPILRKNFFAESPIVGFMRSMS